MTQTERMCQGNPHNNCYERAQEKYSMPTIAQKKLQLKVSNKKDIRPECTMENCNTVA